MPVDPALHFAFRRMFAPALLWQLCRLPRFGGSRASISVDAPRFMYTFSLFVAQCQGELPQFDRRAALIQQPSSTCKGAGAKYMHLLRLVCVSWKSLVVDAICGFRQLFSGSMAPATL